MMISCIRCGGLLVRERIFEANGMSSTERVDCERCLNCGAVEDDIIRANRQPAGNPLRMREPRRPRNRARNSTALVTISIDPHDKGAHHEPNWQQAYIYTIRPDSGDGNPIPSHCLGGAGRNPEE